MIKAELFPTHLGDGNVSDAFNKKECSILLQLYGLDCKSKIEWIINAEEAIALTDNLQKCFADALKIGVKLV